VPLCCVAAMHFPLDQAKAAGLCVVAADSFTARGKVVLKMGLQLAVIPMMALLFWVHRRCHRPKWVPEGESLLSGQATSAERLHLSECPWKDRGSDSSATRGKEAVAPELGTPCSGCIHHSAAHLSLRARVWAASVNVGLTAYAILLLAVLQMVTCVRVPGTSPGLHHVLIQADVRCKGGAAGLAFFGVLGVALGPVGVWYAAQWSMLPLTQGLPPTSVDGTLDRRMGLRNALTAGYKVERSVFLLCGHPARTQIWSFCVPWQVCTVAPIQSCKQCSSSTGACVCC
jgi:hypothetical protein